METTCIILNLVKVQSVISKRFDALSLHGLSLTDFMILHILYHEKGCRLRRIDLAEKTGFTASGITRLLLPLEKIGLVMREAYERDARVSYVKLTKTGSEVFADASKTAAYVSDKLLSGLSPQNIELLNTQLNLLGGDLNS